ncbi:MAG: ComF family protein, partial [Bacteroidota bacterium]
MTIRQGLNSLLHLFYPELCLACERDLPVRDTILCPTCAYELPLTEQWKQVENAFTEKFWGRVPIEAAAALYFFSAGGRVRHLIHQLKFHRQEH